MPLYHFKALTAQGAEKEGSEAAASYAEMLSRIRQRHYYPVSIEEVITGKDLKTLPMFEKVRIKHIAVFCRQFATVLGAGVTIVNSLDILRQQTQSKRLRDVIAELYEDVQKGLIFSESLKKHRDVFPELMIQMVEAGEASGSLDTVMQRIAIHYEKENKINNRVKSAMVYPIVLSIACVCVVAFLLTYVMPIFIGMFDGSGVALPAPTRMLIFLSNGLKHFWYILLAGIILLIYLFRRFVGTKEGRLTVDGWKLRLPVIKGLTQKVASARFTRTLATLITSGIPLLEAMEDVAGAVGNAVIAEGLMSAREDIRKGVALSVPIRKMGYFPPMVSSMIEIGEESGSLDDILDKTANIYDEEVEMEVQRMLSLLEPLLILFMAVIVGFIAISMVMPMFDMLKTVQ